MTAARPLQPLLLRLLALLLMGLLSARALAQADPPGRVARLNHSEGTITFSPAGDNEWVEAERNRPLTRGDRLWTDRRSRAEIQVGSSSVRMNGHTQLEFLALDDQSAQLSVTQGTVYVRVRSLPEGENFEIDTPNLAYRAAYPGDYRIDVDATRGTTRVTIHSGTGAVYGESGQVLALGGGQQILFRARTLAQVGAQESPPQDNFDRWAAERNRREDQSVSARYVPREVVGYLSLDAHGQWSHDATHGAVWFPQGTGANWAPYRHGRWEWIGPWGWTWIDNAPWGFAPSHYGRWALIDSRWAWVPGRPGLRPIYAPALVAFIGGGSTGDGWSIPIASGGPGVAWFPLAPREAWQPGFPASPIYISNVNRNMPPRPVANHTYQARPEALTAISAEDFHRGRPIEGSWLRVATNTLTKAQIVPPPPMPATKALAAREPAPASARAGAPPQADIRQVAAGATQQQPRPAEQAKLDEQARLAREAKLASEQARKARLAEEAKLAEQAKAAEQARLAEQAKVAQQAKLLEKAKLAEEARLARQAKLAEQKQLAEQAKAEKEKLAEQKRLAELEQAAEQARAKQARLAEQQARVAEQQSKLEQQARAAQRAKLAESAQAPEPASVPPQKARAAGQTRLTPEAKAAQPATAAMQAKSVEQVKPAEQRRQAQARRAAEQAKGVPQSRAAQRLARQDRRASQMGPQAKAAEPARRSAQSRRLEQARLEKSLKREAVARRAESSRRDQLAKETLARRAEQSRREEKARREAHAQRVEQARRAADREAEALREQRAQARRNAQEREQQARREAQEREQQAQREAWERQQQALSEQWRRDHQAWEQQQQQRTRQRPDLRNDRRQAPPEVWQRGIPILNPGRTS